MTVLECLKEAIKTKNFQLVADAIEMISGEVLEVDVEEEDPVVAQIRQIEEQLAALKGIKTQTEIKPKSSKKNLFEEMKISAPNEDVDNVINDKINRDRKPRPPSEKAYNCSECGRKKTVSKALYRENHICDDCLLKKVKHGSQ
jgi:hypothetical protein